MKITILALIAITISVIMLMSVIPMQGSASHSASKNFVGNEEHPVNKIYNLPSAISIINTLQYIPMKIALEASSQGMFNKNFQSEFGASAGIHELPSSNSFLSPMGYVENTLDLNNNQIYLGEFSGQNSVISTGIAYDPANGLIYVESFLSTPKNITDTGNFSAISVYSSVNQSLIKVIPLQVYASSLYYDSVNGYLYVADTSNSIIVINTTTNNITAGINLVGDEAFYMASSPNGTVYATSANDTIIIIHNTNIVGYINLTQTPYGIAYDNSNGYIYVSMPGYSNNSSEISEIGAVAIINPAHPSSMNYVDIGYYVLTLAYSSGIVFGTELFSNKIVEISGSSIVGNITGNYGSFSIFTNPYNGNLYVSYIGNQKLWQGILNLINSGNSNSKFFFNSTPEQVLQGGLSIYSPSGSALYNSAMETGPVWIAFNPNNGVAYLNSILPGEIMEMSGFQIVKVIVTMSTPSDSYYDPYYNFLYIADMTQGRVLVYNATTEALVTMINTGGMPFRIAHDESGKAVYVTNMLNASIDQISGTALTKVYTVGYLDLSANQTAGLSLKYLIPVSIAMDPSSSTLYVTTSGYILNSNSSASSANNYQYVAEISSQSGQVSFINTTISAPILGISYDPYNNQVYVDALSEKTPMVVISNGNVNLTATTNLENTIANYEKTHYGRLEAIDSEYYPANNNTYVIMYNPEYSSSPIFPIGYFLMAVYPNDTLVNQTPVPVPLPATAFIQESSGIDVNGINFDPFTNMLMISSFAYPISSSDTASGLHAGFNVTGGIIFMNQSGFQGYVSTGLGTTSAQATGPNSVFVTNGGAGTVSLVKFNTHGLSNLTINIKPANAKLYLNGNIVQFTGGKALLTLPSGNYFIQVSESGYKPYSNYIHLGSGINLTVNVTLVMIQNYGFIEGTVNPDQAVIEANGISIPVIAGSFNVSLEAGSYYVTAFADGYSPYEAMVNVSAGAISYLNISLAKVSVTYEIIGYISPYNISLNPSVLFNGTVAFVNSTGYFMAYVPAGTYMVSATENRYYPVSKNITVDSSMSLVIVLTKEPTTTSQKANSTTLVQAFNATITDIQNNYTAGFVGVTFNSSANSTLVIIVPYSSLSAYYKNLTLKQLFSSKVYINGNIYRNFSITISSNYNVTLEVFGYKGDPVLNWYFIPYAKVTSILPPKKAPPQNSVLSPALLYAIMAVIAVVIVASAALMIQRNRKR